MALGQSISPNANACARESQVQSEACRLRETLNMLHDRLVELGSRIEPVLRSETDCKPSGEKATPQEYLVPLASDYRTNRESVEGMISRVDSYLNRLEL